ncbi:MAG: ATP-binding protein [Legionellaceae bacterium]|nr:ATP-binding protein [Legionellaceae bacterium]
MKISKNELISVLSQFNPWWRSESIPDLPTWHRAAFQELKRWLMHPPAPRAILLSGARQIGKTTLLLQAIEELLKIGIKPGNILYVTFDHPLIKMSNIDELLEAWREREPQTDEIEYIFLDEAQFVRNWGTWIKHQVDFFKKRRIFFTGSAIPLLEADQESGVGRWYTIRLTTLSFYEYLQLKKAVLPTLPKLKSLRDLFEWPQQNFYRTQELALHYVGHFHEYLVRGGFPQTTQVESIHQAQRLLREDIIDKVLKRDMTALFGVRRILELEQTFLYLCMHDGGLLDLADLCNNLEVRRPTAQNFIQLLEATHLIYRLQPFGYGKDILRAKYKIYLADAAIASAVLLKGKNILTDPTALGIASETAVFKHLFARYYAQNVQFSYWRGQRDHEVDLVAQIGEQIIPFEVKYRTQHTDIRALKGLFELCQKKSITHGYVVTKSLEDFGALTPPSPLKTKIMQLPAALLCYWMGAAELETSQE